MMNRCRGMTGWFLLLLAATMVLGASNTAMAETENESYRAYFVGELGGGFTSIPIYEEYRDDSTCDDHCSTLTSVIGIGPTAEFQLAPVFRSHFGFDLGARGNFGYMRSSEDSVHLIMEGHVSGRVYAGLPQARLFAGYEYGHRSVGTTWELASGEDSFRVHTPLAGLELCLGGQYNSPKYCNANLGLEFAYERPEFNIPSEFGPDTTNQGHRPVLNARLGFGNFYIDGTLGRDYPAANPPGAWSGGAQSGVESDTGRMASVGIGLTGDIMNDGGGSLSSGLEFIAILMGAMDETMHDSGTSSSTTAGFGTTPSIDTERDYYLDICDVWKAANSGGHQGTLDRWDISEIPVGAVFDVRIEAYQIPDRYEIDYPAMSTVLDTGWRGASSYDGDPMYPGGVLSPGQDEFHEVFVKGSQNHFEVRVFGEDPQTAWRYDVRCRIP